MSNKVVAASVSLHPSILAYIEEVVDDPESPDFGRSRSFVVNRAIAEYAERKGHKLKLERAKPGRPRKNSKT